MFILADRHFNSAKMVYLKGFFVKLALIFVCIVLTLELTAATKIAYKKPIYGKKNYLKEKRVKAKSEVIKPTVGIPINATDSASTISSISSINTSTNTNTFTAALNNNSSSTNLNPSASKNSSNIINAASTSSSSITTSSAETTSATTESVTSAEQVESTMAASVEQLDSGVTPIVLESPEQSLDTPQLDVPNGNIIASATTAAPTTTATAAVASALEAAASEQSIQTQKPNGIVIPTTTTARTQSNQPVPCTCGVFLSSQIKNSQLGQPLILNEQDRYYSCNAIGRKQCQTKCLEAIVQHLPNSANIVCATLGHDCHKERAYLFIKNCQDQWWNTSLQAGREYCCKNGQPYRCPLVG